MKTKRLVIQSTAVTLCVTCINFDIYWFFIFVGFFFGYRMKWRLFVSTKFTIRLCHKDKAVKEEKSERMEG